MEPVHIAALMVLGFLGLVVAAYLVVRAASIGYFRSRQEFENSNLDKFLETRRKKRQNKEMDDGV